MKETIKELKSKNLIIIGASSLGIQMAHYLDKDGYIIEGFLDDFNTSGQIKNYQILGTLDHRKYFKDNIFVLGIGYKHLSFKNNLYKQMFKESMTFGHYIHETAYIDDSIVIPDGLFVLPNSTIEHGTDLGSNIFIYSNTVIAHDCKIGNSVFFAPGAVVSGNVIIEDECFIGAGSVIKDSVKIAKNCIIGSGTVVIHDLNESGIYIGVPARKIKDVNLKNN